jgi:hypothetical protein
MTERDQDRRRVALTVPAAPLGRRNEPVGFLQLNFAAKAILMVGDESWASAQ